MKYLWILMAGITGAFISRFHGGGFIDDVSRVIRNSLWSLPFAGVAAYSFHTHGYDWYWSLIASILCFSLCFAGKTTGHGQWFLNRAVVAQEPEKLDFLLKPFYGNDPRTDSKYKKFRHKKLSAHMHSIIKGDMEFYGMGKLFRRNLSGMAIVGLASVSGSVITFLFAQPLCALIMTISGLLKAFAYIIGWGISDKYETEIGEYLSGLFIYASLAIALLIILK